MKTEWKGKLFVGILGQAPRQETRTRMKIVAPAMAGHYQLMVTIVQDGVCWFENCGFRPQILTISVASRHLGITG